MSNIKKNCYVSLKNYNSGVDDNYSKFFEFYNTKTTNYDQLEPFGSFSIAAAVRFPWNRGRGDPNYEQKILPGVN